MPQSTSGDLFAVESGLASEKFLLVPLHPDNWALSLGSGYIDGALRADRAADLQSIYPDGVIGFCGCVPIWALAEGEGKERVVVKVPFEGQQADGEPAYVAGPVKVTDALEACFGSDSARSNFLASYDAFPDIPVSLVPSRVGGYDVIDSGRPPLQVPGPHRRDGDRQTLDFLAGWSAGLLKVLETGQNDQAVATFLAASSGNLAKLADACLLAFDPGSEELDLVIWRSAILGLRSRYDQQGFDRRDFLEEIKTSISALGRNAALWADGCRKVIDAEIDIPELGDDSKLGRRAVLALLMAHEPRSLEELKEFLGVGPKVGSLVMLAAYSFAGIARLDIVHKTPRHRFGAVLAISGAMNDGRPVAIGVEQAHVEVDLSRVERVFVAGEFAFDRSVPPPPHMSMLRARIQEAGYKVELDKLKGCLVIAPPRASGKLITVEDDRLSTRSDPVVNLVLEVGNLPARATLATYRSFLETAWNFAVAIAIRPSEGGDIVVALCAIPLATLDRDELAFHVERLVAVSEVLGKKAAPKTRRKKEEKGELPLIE